MTQAEGSAKDNAPVRRKVVSLRHLVAALDNNINAKEHNEAEAYLQERLGSFRCDNSDAIEKFIATQAIDAEKEHRCRTYLVVDEI